MKNINGQNILAAAIAVSLGCSLTEFLPAAYAAPTDTAQTVSNDADDSLMDFSLDAMTVEAKRPDWESKLSPGTVNIVRPDEFKGEQKSLPDLLLTVPGVHVREVNGKGQYTTVTMRGSTAAQVGIFIDGVLRFTAVIFPAVLAVLLWAVLSTLLPKSRKRQMYP